jgi:hypothetical protein
MQRVTRKVATFWLHFGPWQAQVTPGCGRIVLRPLVPFFEPPLHDGTTAVCICDVHVTAFNVISSIQRVFKKLFHYGWLSYLSRLQLPLERFSSCTCLRCVCQRSLWMCAIIFWPFGCWIILAVSSGDILLRTRAGAGSQLICMIHS